MLFMGEEWGTRTPWQFFTDHPEPDLAAAVRDGRRREFGGHGWDELVRRRHRGARPAGPRDVPTLSVLDRAELDDPAHPEHARLLDWYRDAHRPAPDGPGPGAPATSPRPTSSGAAPPSATGRTCRGTAGWCCTAGAARVVINLSGDEAAVPVRTDDPLDVVAAWDPVAVEPTPGGALVAHARLGRSLVLA